MSEEKKDMAKTPKAPEAAAAPEAPKPEATKVPETPKPEAAKAPEAKPAEKTKKERPSTCAGCGKSIKKKRWYYRDGKFYCTKRCWHSKVKNEKKEAAPGEAPAAVQQ